MAFSMNCNNKGCGKYQTPYLDLSDGEVHCQECANVIKNIPIFTKNQMKSMGQTKKAVKKAFSVRCDKCKAETNAKIDDKDQLVCAICNTKTNVSKPFELIIRDAIKKGDQDL